MRTCAHTHSLYKMLFSHLNLCLAFLLEMIASKLHQFGAGLSADVDTMSWRSNRSLIINPQGFIKNSFMNSVLYPPQSTNLFEKEIGEKILDRLSDN